MFRKSKDGLDFDKLFGDFFNRERTILDSVERKVLLETTVIVNDHARKATVPVNNIDYVQEYDGVTFEGYEDDVAHKRCKTIIFLKTDSILLSLDKYEDVINAIGLKRG